MYVGHVNQFGLSPAAKKYFNINNKLSRDMEIFIEFSVWVGYYISHTESIECLEWN